MVIARDEVIDDHCICIELDLLLIALYGQSLASGNIPNDWPHALETLLFQTEDVHKPGNFLPVSLTSVTQNAQAYCV